MQQTLQTGRIDLDWVKIRILLGVNLYFYHQLFTPDPVVSPGFQSVMMLLCANKILIPSIIGSIYFTGKVISQNFPKAI